MGLDDESKKNILDHLHGRIKVSGRKGLKSVGKLGGSEVSGVGFWGRLNLFRNFGKFQQDTNPKQEVEGSTIKDFF